MKQIYDQAGRPFSFYLHPCEVDPWQPRVKDISAFSRFRHYTNLHKCESRLRRVLGDFSFGTMREVLEGRGLLAASAGASQAATPTAAATAVA